MPDAEDIDAAIAANATGPKKVQVGNTGAEQHPLADQIAAGEHLANKAATSKAGLGITFRQFVPPGAG